MMRKKDKIRFIYSITPVIIVIIYITSYGHIPIDTRPITNAFLLLFAFICTICSIANANKPIRLRSKKELIDAHRQFAIEQMRLDDIHKLTKDMGISKKELYKLVDNDEKYERLYDGYLSDGNESYLREIEQLLRTQHF
jgi:hypothetical protein